MGLEGLDLNLIKILVWCMVSGYLGTGMPLNVSNFGWGVV